MKMTLLNVTHMHTQSPAVLDSSSYPPLTHTPPGGKKYPNKRGGMASGRGGGRTVSYTPQDSMNVDYSGGTAGNYMYSPTGGGGGATQVPSAAAVAAANLIRTSLQQVPNQQSKENVILRVPLASKHPH